MKKKDSISRGIIKEKNVSAAPLIDSISRITPPILWQVVPNHEEHGKVVKITGGGFGTDASNVEVKFNGVTAEVHRIQAVAEDQEIIFTSVPQYADSGDVTVTVNGQTSNPSPFVVDWTANVVQLTSHPANSLFNGHNKIIFTDPHTPGVFEVSGDTFGPHPVSTLAQGRAIGEATGITRIDRIVGNQLVHEVIITDPHGHHINKIDDLGNVSVFAGRSVGGYSDGPAQKTKFNRPYGIAFYRGNFYVTDIGNYRIRKISRDGAVSTFAGSNVRGQLDSTDPLTAQFSGLHAICVDEEGNVYVTDWHMVRKISSLTGDVTTIAGSDRGYHDDRGKLAKFNDPKGMAAGADGAIYIADTYNNKIRRITPDGTVTTVVKHNLDKPTGIVLNGSDTFNHLMMYVADADGVKKIYFT